MPAGAQGRVYRSRVIWDETRKEGSSYQAYMNAILYELQPFPKNAISSSLTRLGHSMHWMITQFIPAMSKFLYQHVIQWKKKEWAIVFAIFLFWQFVRFLHSTLEAGPIALMMTALVAIFTIGLSDDTANADGLSAYSVFNHGFERLLGSIDVENLLNQHVGGALAIPINQQQQPPEIDDDNAHVEQHNNHPNENHVVNHNHNLDQNDHVVLDDPIQPPQPPQPRSRKSAKKTRRKNQQRRKDLQRQRDAAAALGFIGEGQEEDFQALQQLQ